MNQKLFVLTSMTMCILHISVRNQSHGRYRKMKVGYGCRMLRGNQQRELWLKVYRRGLMNACCVSQEINYNSEYFKICMDDINIKNSNMSESSSNKRRSSKSSQKSFHSIQQFNTNPFDTQVIGRRSRFPFRPAVNILLIILTTLQVYLLIHSRIYLRGDLVRTFLSVYMDQQKYSNLFNGQQFYLKIIDINQLSQHFEYMFQNMRNISHNSFIDMAYNDSKIMLHIQYSSLVVNKSSVYQLEIDKGIRQPFNMSNITDIQLFLLQVQRFEIKIDNLTVKQNWEGFSQKYIHVLSYGYTDSIQVQLNFQFNIDNAMVKDDEDDYNYDDSSKNSTITTKQKQQQLKTQQTYPIMYIIKIRIFYGIVLVLTFISLYLNYLLIRRTFNILYQQLGQTTSSDITSQNNQIADIDDEHPQQTKSAISRWVHANKLTLQQLRLQHFIHVLEFDIIFSTLSNVFEIIAGFYLIYGIQKQRIAGIACLLSWMTIFRLIRRNKKLSLMYQLIKLSIAKVTRFFVQFVPVFIAYALLGICLFPKVSFFASLADSVTTLVCLMMGDSIQLITNSIIKKNSVLIGIIYIFSFVLLFMHAIHNTLTSLIKQFFIQMKIDLVIQQKKDNKETQKYIYLQEVQLENNKKKKGLPLKLTTDLQKYVVRERNYGESFIIDEKIKQLGDWFDGLCVLDEKNMEDQLLGDIGEDDENYKEIREYIVAQLQRRLNKVHDTLHTLGMLIKKQKQSNNNNKQGKIRKKNKKVKGNTSSEVRQSLLTDQQKQ